MIENRAGSVRLTIHAQPRASRTELAGRHGDSLKIRLAAAPLEGAANAELIRFLARRLGVPKSAVRVVKGERRRDKVVEIAGLSAKDVAAKLA